MKRQRERPVKCRVAMSSPKTSSSVAIVEEPLTVLESDISTMEKKEKNKKLGCMPLINTEI